MSLTKIAIFFSGEGSNLEALIQALHQQKREKSTIKVALTLTNNKEANGIKRSQKYGIEPIVLEHKSFQSREAFDTKLVEILQKNQIDLVVLAGFMRILTPIFTNQIKAINIHPSLLPLFKGANALERSFQSDMKVAGITTHMVESELDSGEIIDQVCFSKEGLDFEDFKKKLHQLEHQLYPNSVWKVVLRDK